MEVMGLSGRRPKTFPKCMPKKDGSTSHALGELAAACASGKPAKQPKATAMGVIKRRKRVRQCRRVSPVFERNGIRFPICE